PPLWSRSCTRTRSGASVSPQQRHVAFARRTVPSGTSLALVGVNTSNSRRGGWPFGRTTLCRSARLRLAFLQSQNDRTSGISAPHLGDSQRTVLDQRYAIGRAPSGSAG